jgi:hypothetical protein
MMFEMTLFLELGIIWSTFEEGYIFVIVWLIFSSVVQNWTSWNLSIQLSTQNNTTSRSKDSTKFYPVCTNEIITHMHSSNYSLD